MSAFAVVFCALFFAFHLPELLVRLGMAPADASLVLLVFFIVAAVAARWLRSGFGRAYALEWNLRAARWLVFLLLASVFGKAVALTVGMVSGVYAVKEGAVIDDGATAVAGALALLAGMTFFPSLAEDMLTRGLWVREAPWRWQAASFLGFSSLVYVLNHVWRLQRGPSEWVLLGCFGLAYAAALWQSGTLWAAVGLHWGWNLAGAAADRLWHFEVVNPSAAWTLSAGMHLLFLAGLLALGDPRTRRPE